MTITSSQRVLTVYNSLPVHNVWFDTCPAKFTRVQPVKTANDFPVRPSPPIAIASDPGANSLRLATGDNANKRLVTAELSEPLGDRLPIQRTFKKVSVDLKLPTGTEIQNKRPSPAYHHTQSRVTCKMRVAEELSSHDSPSYSL